MESLGSVRALDVTKYPVLSTRHGWPLLLHVVLGFLERKTLGKVTGPVETERQLLHDAATSRRS